MFGEITDVRVIQKMDKSLFRYGFITFKDYSSVVKCLNMGFVNIRGRQVGMKSFTSKNKKNNKKQAKRVNKHSFLDQNKLQSFNFDLNGQNGNKSGQKYNQVKTTGKKMSFTSLEDTLCQKSQNSLNLIIETSKTKINDQGRHKGCNVKFNLA